MWLKPGCTEDVVDASEGKLRIVIVVSFEVVIIINLCIVVVSIVVVLSRCHFQPLHHHS
jgi:hypothetical protein